MAKIIYLLQSLDFKKNNEHEKKNTLTISSSLFVII